jgi:hypothetical protein
MYANSLSVVQLYAYSVMQYTNPRTKYGKIRMRVTAITLKSVEAIL